MSMYAEIPIMAGHSHRSLKMYQILKRARSVPGKSRTIGRQNVFTLKAMFQYVNTLLQNLFAIVRVGTKPYFFFLIHAYITLISNAMIAKQDLQSGLPAIDDYISNPTNAHFYQAFILRL